jgi:hypothetical protein
MENKNTVIKPVLTINQVYGMVKTKKQFADKDYKKAIQKAVIEKFKSRYG